MLEGEIRGKKYLQNVVGPGLEERKKPCRSLYKNTTQTHTRIHTQHKELPQVFVPQHLALVFPF